MSLVTKTRPAAKPATPPAVVANGLTKTMTRDADANRKRARTLAKQQQAAERVASASGQLSSGINEAASAAEELSAQAHEIAALVLELVQVVQGEAGRQAAAESAAHLPERK